MKRKVHYDQDVKTTYLKDKTVAIIGYGSQGNAQSQNLRDSSVRVILGLEEEWKQLDESWRLAESAGFEIYNVAEATRKADIIQILIPDMAQPTIYEAAIKPNLAEGKALGFSHGFNIHFEQIIPPKNVDVFMVAPKSPGPLVRELYSKGFGSPALIAVYQDYTGKSEDIVLEIAKALGCTRAGVIKTTFKDETESDLIGEQTVLVGGVMELLKKGFEVLVEEGYPPELSYYEACNELKLIVDLIYQKGLTGMLFSVSETARWGGVSVGPKIIDDHVKENMRRAAREVKDRTFAKNWIAEYKSGRKNLRALVEKVTSHQIESVGREIRRVSGLEK